MKRQAIIIGFLEIDLEWMREAHRLTRKDGATGIDGESAEAFASKLDENLERLMNAAKDGDKYRAPPVRYTEIPKSGDPKATRPLGIPCFSAKVLQRAVTMCLEPLYEQDFRNCSYGLDPKGPAAIESRI